MRNPQLTPTVWAIGGLKNIEIYDRLGGFAQITIWSSSSTTTLINTLLKYQSYGPIVD
jgi:hypothetical protein